MTENPDALQHPRSLRLLTTNLVRAGTGLLTAVSIIIVLLWAGLLHERLTYPDGKHFEIDFSVFWGAARLAVDGAWGTAFDLEALKVARSLETAPANGNMPWFYPPSFQVMLWPLGFLSHFWAWVAFVSVSCVGLAIAAFPVVRGDWRQLVFLLCAPVTLLLVAMGQSSILLLAFLFVGIEAMKRDQYVVAGLAFALMTIKPQLGLAIPIALVAGGYWRVIGWGFVWTLLLLAFATIVVGIEYWSLFFDNLGNGLDSSRPPPPSLMVSVQGAARAMGFSVPTANAAQIATSVTVAALLAWQWARRSRSFDQLAAALCFSTILLTPYALFYDLIIVLGGFIYLARSGFGSRVWEFGMLAAIWIGPALCWWYAPAPLFATMVAVTALGLGVAFHRSSAPAHLTN